MLKVLYETMKPGSSMASWSTFIFKSVEFLIYLFYLVFVLLLAINLVLVFCDIDTGDKSNTISSFYIIKTKQNWLIRDFRWE